MSEVKLAAAKRTEFGKGAARRLRRAHQIPAVIYGHGAEPVHVALPGHATMLALKKSNALLSVDVEGKPMLTLPKDVQRDPLKGTIEHVDLVAVRRGERVVVDIALHLVGEAEPGTMITTEMNTLSIEVEATSIPSSIDVDLTGAAADTLIHAKDVVLPAGSVLVTDPDATVIHIGGANRGEAAEDAAEESAEQ